MVDLNTVYISFMDPMGLKYFTPFIGVKETQ